MHGKALEELREAIKARSIDQLEAALKRCKKVELPDSDKDVVAGTALLDRVVKEKDQEEELLAAAESKDAERID